MLQALYLDVSKVDQMLHMGCAWEEGGAQAVPTRATYGRREPRVGTGYAGVVERHPGSVGPRVQAQNGDGNQLQPRASVRTSGR
jgi:hypothetical protein